MAENTCWEGLDLISAHAAWLQRRGGGLSLVTGRPRDLARVRNLQVRARDVCNIPSSGCPYIPFIFNMIAVAGGGINAMDVSKNVRA